MNQDNLSIDKLLADLSEEEIKQLLSGEYDDTYLEVTKYRGKYYVEPLVDMTNIEKVGVQTFASLMASYFDFATMGRVKTPYSSWTFSKLIKQFENPKFDDFSLKKKTALLQEAHNRYAAKLGIPAVKVKIREHSLDDDEDDMQIYMATGPSKYVNGENQSIVVNKLSEYAIPYQFLRPKKDGKGEEVEIRYLECSSGVHLLRSLIHETKHVQQFYDIYNIFKNREVNGVNALIALHGLITMAKGDYRSGDFVDTYALSPMELDAELFADRMMRQLQVKGYLKVDIKSSYEFYLDKVRILQNYGYKTRGVKNLRGRRVIRKMFAENIIDLGSLQNVDIVFEDKHVRLKTLFDGLNDDEAFKAYIKSLESQLEKIYEVCKMNEVDLCEHSTVSDKVRLQVMHNDEINPEFIFGVLYHVCTSEEDYIKAHPEMSEVVAQRKHKDNLEDVDDILDE